MIFITFLSTHGSMLGPVFKIDWNVWESIWHDGESQGGSLLPGEGLAGAMVTLTATSLSITHTMPGASAKVTSLVLQKNFVFIF